MIAATIEVINAGRYFAGSVRLRSGVLLDARRQEGNGRECGLSVLPRSR